MNLKEVARSIGNALATLITTALLLLAMMTCDVPVWSQPLPCTKDYWKAFDKFSERQKTWNLIADLRVERDVYEYHITTISHSTYHQDGCLVYTPSRGDPSPNDKQNTLIVRTRDGKEYKHYWNGGLVYGFTVQKVGRELIIKTLELTFDIWVKHDCELDPTKVSLITYFRWKGEV